MIMMTMNFSRVFNLQGISSMFDAWQDVFPDWIHVSREKREAKMAKIAQKQKHLFARRTRLTPQQQEPTTTEQQRSFVTSIFASSSPNCCSFFPGLKILYPQSVLHCRCPFNERILHFSVHKIINWERNIASATDPNVSRRRKSELVFELNPVSSDKVGKLFIRKNVSTGMRMSGRQILYNHSKDTIARQTDCDCRFPDQIQVLAFQISFNSCFNRFPSWQTVSLGRCAWEQMLKQASQSGDMALT